MDRYLFFSFQAAFSQGLEIGGLMGRTDQWSGAAFLIISACICCGSALLPYGNVHNPGPGFLPFWLGVVLGGMSIGLILQSSLRKAKGKRLRELLAEKVRWVKVFSTLVALILYAVLMDHIGFLITTFFLILYLIRFIDPQSWKKALGWALVGSIGAHLVFNVWLQLRLPKGFLGI
jgi:putative tricarboxylic transport membrane protein